MFKPMDEAHIKDLYEAFAVLKSADEISMFMQDLCTPQELVAIAQRYQIAKLLSENCRYAEIVEKTGTSTATISRVKKCLVYGSGGYRHFPRGCYDRLRNIYDETCGYIYSVAERGGEPSVLQRYGARQQ